MREYISQECIFGALILACTFIIAPARAVAASLPAPSGINTARANCTCVLTSGDSLNARLPVPPASDECAAAVQELYVNKQPLFTSCAAANAFDMSGACTCAGGQILIETPSQQDCSTFSTFLIKNNALSSDNPCVWTCPKGKTCDTPNETQTKIPYTPIAPKLAINIPTIKPFTTENMQKPDENGYVYIPFIGQYASGFYGYILLIAGLVASIIIIIAGFQYITAGGNSSQIEAAKSRLGDALIGLLIVFGSYALLYTLNPDLVQFKSLKIQVITPVDLPGDDSASSEGQNASSKGVQCFIDNFGDPSTIKSRLVDVKLLNKTFGVHPLAAPAFKAVAAQIASVDYILKNPYGKTCPAYTPGMHGGSSATFNIRPNANDKSKLSLHSFGVAIDLNTCANPNRLRKDGCYHDIPDSIINAFKANGFKWGGDFKGHCDTQHFEWYGPCAKGASGGVSKPAATASQGQTTVAQYCCNPPAEGVDPQTVNSYDACTKIGGTVSYEGPCS